MEELRIITLYSLDINRDIDRFAKKIIESFEKHHSVNYYSQKDHGILYYIIEGEEFIIDLSFMVDEVEVDSSIEISLLSGYSVINVYIDILRFIWINKFETSIIGGNHFFDYNDKVSIEENLSMVKDFIYNIFKEFRSEYTEKIVKCRPYETENYINSGGD